MHASRRHFLQVAAAGGAALSTSGMAMFAGLPAVSADEAKLDPSRVQLQPEIEPLVRLLEETPRGKLLEEVAARIRRGTSYQEVVAALLLAGVRNVEPRPSVGHKFHAVLVVNSAHIASLASPDNERWLPIFWALDYFKSSQAQDVREGNWTMGPVNEAEVPRPSKAREAFIAAMENWDVEAADAAAAGLARGLGANETFDLFAYFGSRDFRSIGHKAIYVANAWRTLNSIGWQHAEPVLRSLAYALLMHTNEPNPAKNDLVPDRAWRRNLELVGKVSETWGDGKVEEAATRDLIISLRTDSPEAAAAQVVELLGRGVAPQSIWDGLFLGAGELLGRQPGIVALHAMTTTNALSYAWRTAADDRTRKLLLLQNAAFLPHFREAMQSRGRVGDFKVDELAAEQPTSAAKELQQQILRNIDSNPQNAARETLAFASSGGDVNQLISAARQQVFFKGNDAHDYKFSSAVLEDYYHVSPVWRDRFLAASVFKLVGSEGRDNPLVGRTREALKIG